MVPKELRYTKEHEWVRLEDGRARVGITHHAQKSLGDIVYVELPPPGRVAKKGERVATVESVKAVGEVFSPLSGKVVEVNPAVAASPDLINKDPYGQGWLFALEVADAREVEALLSPEAYEELLKGGG
ncbi:MAG: glycine cleavage system protein GcvH [Candidatus Bipolaricaulota bacterium]|nr:glycine cleavage system protein GcvH [Candidatus Bipolaricaulota bacterium]MDW8152357.1 glycine cleavage system protein GcvH [Candidatus Bipolaricaulota bacterium]